MTRRAPRLAAGRARALGLPTRGTTAPNRLRRMDRWLVAEAAPALRRATDPLVVDLGYGSSPVTTAELAARLRTIRPDVRVLGLENDAERVAAAQHAADPPWLEFRRGSFDVDGTAPTVIRAANVLRQYPEPAVAGTWAAMRSALAPGGLLVEGTTSELGRRGCWVGLDADGPRTLTLACLPSGLERPSDLAERLPKALIHRNVSGEPVHALLVAFDRCWDLAAPVIPFGPRVRWAQAVRLLSEQGWPVRGAGSPGQRRRARAGEVTLDWSAVS